jgi:Sigma-70, region 4
MMKWLTRPNSSDAAIVTPIIRAPATELRRFHDEAWWSYPMGGAGTRTPSRIRSLMYLDRLSSEERAVFVLREVLEYSYAEIASVLNGTEGNCRQLFHRAKERLRSGQSRSARSHEQKRKLAERLVSAMRAGDGNELTRLLAADVGFWGDGGGRVVAARRPVLGRDSVVRLLLGIRRSAQAQGYARDWSQVALVEVNYDPAMLVPKDGHIDSVYVCSTEGDAITGIRVARNPDKLVYLARQLSATAAHKET